MKYSLLIFLLFAQLFVHAGEKYYVKDSLDFSKVEKMNTKHKKFVNTNLYKIASVPASLIGVGLLVKIENEHFRSLRMDYASHLSMHFDDYLQYSPAALMLGLKIGGVKGRSSWGRMGVSDAFSAGIMATLVNSLKYTTKVERPNKESHSSFPSGHTATAFMTATMLHKEFGHLSRWYSVGAYTAASVTGLMRMANNKHWLSDVLVGAGIGVLSTNLGYFLADLIYKDRGLYYEDVENENVSWRNIEKPSYFGISLGLTNTIGNLKLQKDVDFGLEKGSRASLEGAYFFNKYWGLGGSVSLTNSPIKIDNVILDESLSVFSAYLGANFAYPVANRIRLGAKAYAGYNHYQDVNINGVDVDAGDKFGMRAGVSAEYLFNRMWAMRFFADYDAILLSGLPKSNVHQVVVFGGTGVMVF